MTAILMDGLTKFSNHYGSGIITEIPIAPGTPLLQITGRLTRDPGMYTIQIEHQVHISPDGQLWGFFNHSCRPNCHIDFISWSFIARQVINPGEELTFNYLTTEWCLSNPFMCMCGADECFGWITGFCHLSEEQRAILVADCSPYLREQIEAEIFIRP